MALVAIPVRNKADVPELAYMSTSDRRPAFWVHSGA